MKILQTLVFPLWGSGSGTYARKLSEYLATLGHEVAIIAPETRKVKGVKLYPLEMPFHAAFTMHPEWPDAKRYADLTEEEICRLYLVYFRAVVQAVEDFKPDVIHVHHCSIFAWVASFLKSIYGINYLVSAHGTGIMTASIDSRYTVQTKIALGRAEFLVPVSGDTKRWMLRVFDRRLDWRTRVITGGIDLKDFSEKGSFKKIEDKYHLKDKRVVIFTGKLTKIKGVDYLIKAAPKIKGDIYIIGDGEERPALEELKDKLKAENVHFLGYFSDDQAEEMQMFYRRAEVAVFPSVWDEPLGLVILEAMACSTPVVASKRGGIPLAVKNGQNGFLVRARSPKQIAEAVNKILNNPELRNKLAEGARRIVEERFDWLKIARQFEKLYEETSKRAKASRQARKMQREQETRRLDEQKRKELLSHRVAYKRELR